MALGGLAFARKRLAVVVPRIERRLLVYVAAFSCIPLSFVVYWPSIGQFFMSDDFVVLRAVRDRSTWDVIVRAFTFPQSKPLDEATLSWRPLTDLYFYAMSPLGIHAQPHHVVNVALHGTVGALGALLVYRLSRSSVAAAVTGILFTVVPTYDFTVDWIVEFAELSTTVFILSALLTYHLHLTSEHPGRAAYAATCAFVGLAILSKESSLLLMFLLPALAIWARASGATRRSRIAVVRGLVPFLSCFAVYVVAMQVHDAQVNDLTRSLGTHVIGNFWHYLRWLVLPYQDGRLEAIRTLLAVGFLIAGVLTLVTRRWTLGLLFVWTIAAALLYTEIRIVELRYTYLATLPFIGFVTCLALEVLAHLPQTWSRPIATLGAGLVIAAVVAGALRTRDVEQSFAVQSSQYENALNATRNLCGDLDRGAYVYLLDPPFFDAYGLNASAALNLYYDHVHVAAVSELPPLAAFIKDKCVIQYEASSGRYERLG